MSAHVKQETIELLPHQTARCLDVDVSLPELARPAIGPVELTLTRDFGARQYGYMDEFCYDARLSWIDAEGSHELTVKGDTAELAELRRLLQGELGVPASPVVPASAPAAGPLPPPLPSAALTRLLTALALALPAGVRVRWVQEWVAELAELPRRRRAGFVARLTVLGVPRMAWALRRSRVRRASEG